MLKMRAIIFSACALVVVACGGGGGSSNSNGGQSVTPPPPVTNRPPIISTPSELVFLEGNPVMFQIEASDPEGRDIGYSLKLGGDSELFSIRSNGLILANAQSEILDFEAPTDGNADNIYELMIGVTDGLNEVTKGIQIRIEDVGDQLSCSSPGVVDIAENRRGDIYTFQITDPEMTDFYVEYDIEEVRVRGNDEINFDIGGALVRGSANGFDGTYTVRIFEIFNAEAQPDLNDVFTYSFNATTRESTVECSMDFRITDVPNEVKSGVKISGKYFQASALGDMNQDGHSESWSSKSKQTFFQPWLQEGRFIFGENINAALRTQGGIERTIRPIIENDEVRFFGSFGFEDVFAFIGNELIASSVNDMDGDGLDELLITESTGNGAVRAARADRPLAFLIWGDTLAQSRGGEINLNDLTPAQGIIFDGLGGIDRRGNIATAGDMDGDDIADIIVGVPSGSIQATDTSVYSSPVFIVFGDFVLEQKALGAGNIDLLEDLNTLDPNQSVVLLNESTTLNDQPAPPESTFFASAGQITVIENDVPGEADSLQQLSSSQRQFFARMSVLDGSFVKNAKGSSAVLRYEDAPIQDRTILTFKGDTPVLPNNTGDVDGDGKTDIMLGRSDFQSDNGFADLFLGAGLEQVPPGEIFELEESYANVGFVRFTNNGTANVNSQSHFLGDIDGDGRDDIALGTSSYIDNGPEADATINTSVVIILAKALDDLPSDRLFNVDELLPGQGLKIINGEMGLEGSGPVLSSLEDIDGDMRRDLFISTNNFGNATYRDVYVVLAADIMSAINDGTVTFDLDEAYVTGH